ncbi:MAG: PAS domain-containing protein [Alphaproteobacteria bacterium]|nr:PAS domain-containing protein [Alphaproteobacteria bacterium]
MTSAPTPLMAAEIDALAHSKLRALLRHWQDRRTDGAIPDRTLLDPIALAPWLGNLLLIECLEGERFRYRLYGTGFVEAFGREWTGHDLAELPPDQYARLREEYLATLEAGQPTCRRHRARFTVPLPGGAQPSGDVEMTWERLVLPLADHAGGVTLLLVGAFALPEEGEA